MSNRTRSMRLALASGLAAVAITTLGAGSAQAAFGVKNFEFTTSTTQAGGHPDLIADITFNRKPDPIDTDPRPTTPPPPDITDGTTRDVVVDPPAGITGNPENITPCPQEDFNAGRCKAESQVGLLQARVTIIDGAQQGGVWLVQPRNEDETARLESRLVNMGFNIIFTVRFDSDYGLRTTATGLPPGGLSPYNLRLKLFGVPADSSHDRERVDNAGYPLGGSDSDGNPNPYPLEVTPKAFVSNPPSCGPQAPATIVAHSYESPDVDVRATAAPTPAITGCDRVPFAPSFAFRPLTAQADSPSAFDATLTVPRQSDPAGIDASHVRTLDVTLPDGVAISPPGADGLGACGDADLKFGTLQDATCPATARLGDAEVNVPILRKTLTGSVYLRPPTPGNLFRLAIVTSAVGVKLKLVGEAIPDPVTGRLRVVFDNAPQQPVSSVKLHLSGGARAPLATPQSCGTFATGGSVLGWSGALKPVSDSFGIGSGPGGAACGSPFAPQVVSGATGAAGKSGSISFRVTRADGQQNLGSLRTVLAPGQVARLDKITPCTEPAASAGSCPAASRIGTTTVGAGSGSSPLFVRGPVYLTRGYKGAPFGLSIVVPTAGQAGPFDLGNVVVRAALAVDSRTAQVSVQTDPLPTILEGVPLRLRDLRVAIDRPGFTVNPTDCSRKAVATRVWSVGQAASVLRGSAFQVGECSALAYEPKLGLRLTGKGQTTDGKHPGLLAKLRPRSGDANSKTARVTLPSGLALDPQNAETLCEPSAAAANRCPKGSIVGRASARSILKTPVRGNVYLVRGERKDKRTGRTIKTLPKLYIPLSAEGVRIDVNASSAVSKGRLVAAFSGLPDVPLSSFDLRLNGGGNGIIAVSGTNICRGTRVADAALKAHNGRSANDDITLSRPCS